MAGAIFGGNINGICTAMMMVAMLVFAVAWEALTARLDRKVCCHAFGALLETPARPRSPLRVPTVYLPCRPCCNVVRGQCCSQRNADQGV
jgi:hypothetical protein